jgi:hypothetical protein
MEGILAVEQERTEESREIMKSIHKPMKKWYKEQPAEFAKAHGRFPLFWQDLQAWKEWDEVYKAYMIATEDKSAGSALRKRTKEVAAAAADADAAEAATAATAAAATAANAAAANAAADGEAAGLTAASPPPAPPADSDGSSRKRKSRWGSGDDAGTSDASAAPAPRTKSRWGGDVAAGAGGAIAPPPPPGPGPPGGALPTVNMAALGLDPKQLKIMQLRLRLTELDTKLSYGAPFIAAEAAMEAVDPGRSPSPEPVLDPATGERTNTREARLRAKYMTEREKLLSEVVELSGNLFGGPAAGGSFTPVMPSGGMMQRKLCVIYFFLRVCGVFFPCMPALM